MGPDINESDWKAMRKLTPVALDRFCQRILAEVASISADGTMSPHQRYLAIHEQIQKRDRDMANAFNDARRSTAIVQLACLRRHELITDAEFAEFSPETREILGRLLGD
ncbi:peptide ABC transporter substrate-binding protein [Aquisphaera insulae]|uniref:peptide ABC transporter substrate-binding protein n=1 Tax=Aquisphaera insulae TaxID=2712864 RepID=UPI0013EA8953|nr:peptide ABC transporter substrate-binding protein [Aquisphaera insulae]